MTSYIRRTMYIAIIIIMASVTGACSNGESVRTHSETGDQEAPSETSEKDIESAKGKGNTSPSVAKKQHKEEKEHRQTNTFKHAQYHYTIEFPETLVEYLEIDEGKTTKIYYDDRHTLNKKVLLGKIEPVPIEKWERQDETQPYGGIVLIDDQREFVFVYRPNTKEPYAKLVDDDSSDVPEGYIEYYTASELVLNSLFHAGFILGDIQQDQSIPDEFNTEHKEAIAVSEEMYADLYQWQKHLRQHIKEGMSLDEKGEVLFDILYEASEQYPDIQKTSLPTSEMEHNAAQCMNLMEHWSNFPYLADEPNHMFVDNQIIMFEQYVNVIAEQLDEVKRAQS